ncbi:envelope stress induced periplasmic protein, Spy-related protein [Psychromonas ingrahamii 37]|uniref:Envelope stress induced periplasmic protein, Spy-related protein n=1 Tax=Psychromonas ingrahamii (strain DSM 17664 / CCUG 51855 / 37) TaxID=357804 RepID=A1STB9_PSYIN|nr:Spy/CpxP family protein refolding chaperone [Psychromonas ingrahamii]ABM02734.1 envelope stress induced periplasmic protein, Spy-related protein [Psychromonas ingrahamii 37]
MNNKKLSIIALALGLTFANISVSQAHGGMQNNAGGWMHGGMMDSGIMNGGMMNGGMMNGGMINGGMMYGGMMNGGMMNGGMMNGGMMNGGMMNGGMMFSSLNLTGEQQQQIQSIMTAAMASMHSGPNMMTNMQASTAESQALLNSPTFDDAKAREIISKQQALMVDNQLQMLKAHHHAFQVLTEAQQEQVNTLMAEHLALMQQYMKGFQQ